MSPPSSPESRQHLWAGSGSGASRCRGVRRAREASLRSGRLHQARLGTQRVSGETSVSTAEGGGLAAASGDEPWRERSAQSARCGPGAPGGPSLHLSVLASAPTQPPPPSGAERIYPGTVTRSALSSALSAPNPQPTITGITGMPSDTSAPVGTGLRREGR